MTEDRVELPDKGGGQILEVSRHHQGVPQQRSTKRFHRDKFGSKKFRKKTLQIKLSQSLGADCDLELRNRKSVTMQYNTVVLLIPLRKLYRKD